ncbi:MAG: hypothetical protein U1E53_32280 [Dongiaceae bacterium]
MRALARLALLAALLAAPAGLLARPAEAAGDRPVTLTLANDGAVALQCRLMFGHWVDRDLGTLAPGGAVAVALSQQPADGALFVLRDDGRRRMMVETILCGRPGAAPAALGQVDLAPAAAPGGRHRRRRGAAAGGDAACRPVRLSRPDACSATLAAAGRPRHLSSSRGSAGEARSHERAARRPRPSR